MISKPETAYVRIAASSFRKLAKTFKFVPNISASFQRKKISRLRRASPDLLRLSRCWSCTTTCRNGQKKNCRRCTAAVRRAVGGPAAVRAPHHMPLLPGRKRQQAHEQTSSYGRSVQVCCCCTLGMLQHRTRAVCHGGGEGRRECCTLASSTGLLFSHTKKKIQFFLLLFF